MRGARQPQINTGKHRCILFPVFCILFLVGIAAASLQNIPTDSWIYDDLDLLKTSGFVRSMPSTSRPWTRGEAAVLVREADSLSRLGRSGSAQRAALSRLRTEFGDELPDMKPEVGPRRPLVVIPVPVAPDARFQGDMFSRARVVRLGERNEASGSVGAVLSNRPGDKFAFYERVEFTMFRPDSADIEDPAGIHVPGSRVHSWMEFATFEIEHAYLAFKIPWLRLEFGRDEFFWGPGYVSSCMLSDNAPSLDHVQLCASYRNFKFLSFTSYLSRWGLKHRFLSAQRLELSLFDRVTLGGALMNVYSWDSLQTRSLFGMMNPLIPIYLEVANSGHDDNFLVGWDAVVYLPRIKVYGQLFLDNYEFVAKEGQPCNAVGWQVGGFWAPNLGFEFRIEYARINPFTYYHRIYHIMYENWSVPLGHELGPDADQIHARLGFVPFAPLTVSLLGIHTRRGYYNRGNFERKTWHGGQLLPERFPAEGGGEKVECTSQAGIEAGFWLGRDMRIAGSVAYWYSQNYQGAPDNRDGFDVSLRLEYRY